MMWILYQIALALVLAVAAPVLLLLRGRHYLPTLAGRLGGYDGPATTRPLWIHSVSVGEARVAATLARALDADWPLLVTTVTPTGQAQAASLLRDRAAIAYLPLDLGFAVRRFLDRFEPRALVLVEGDYWPLLLRHVRRRGLPAVVVNGRVGERSFGRLRRFPGMARILYSGVRRFTMQTEEDRDRLVELGVDSKLISVTGNLKFDAPVPQAHPEIEAAFSEVAAGRPILIAGSTMRGEDEQILDAFADAGGGDAALLVLAPRHPERWDEVAGLIDASGYRFSRRTDLDTATRADVVLLDSLGELAALYAIATAAFVGGTLVATGGHNPLEPAVHAVPVAVGPSMHNFNEMARIFDDAAAWQRVDDAAGLGRFFDRAVSGDAGVVALGQRGQELLVANRGATQRTLDVVLPILAEAME